MIFNTYTHSPSAVLYDLKSSLLVSAYDDGIIRVWDFSKGVIKEELHYHNHTVEAIAFSDNGKLFASVSSNTIALWNALTWQLLDTYEGMPDYTYNIFFTLDDRMLMGCGASTHYYENDESYSFTSNRIIIQNERRFQPTNLTKQWRGSTYIFKDHKQRITALTTNNNIGWICDYNDGSEIQQLEGDIHNLQVPVLSPNGLFIASDNYKDSSIEIRDINSGAILQTYKYHSDTINCIAFSNDSRYIASGGADGKIAVYDVNEEKLLHTFSGHAGGVRSISFHSTGTFLVSGGEDGTIRLWKIEKANKSIRRVQVNSSQIRSIGYEQTEKILEIEFLDGSVYHYFGVPSGKYIGLMSAQSHGMYFDQHIKRAGYKYRRL